MSSEGNSEIETLHQPFQKWLATAGLVYDYSNPYRRTGAAFRGGADFTIHRNGRALMIEFKDKNTEVSSDQIKRHAELLAQGCQVHVIRDLQAAVTLTVQWLSAMDLPIAPVVERAKGDLCTLNSNVFRRDGRGGWSRLRAATNEDAILPQMHEMK